MEFKKLLSTKRIIFIAAFIILVFFAQKVNFSPLIGADKQYFTLFQFFGPIAGAFLGPILGMVIALGAQLIDFVVVGKEFTIINVIRLAPMLFAAYYFGAKKRNLSVAIPLIAAAIFLVHPVGLQSWFMALYWLIPITIAFLPKRFAQNLVLKSFGATFTAHAVGSALWAWTVPMTKGAWLAVFAVVPYERTLFALGIVGSYLIMNAVLNYVDTKFKVNVPDMILSINRKLVPGFLKSIQ